MSNPRRPPPDPADPGRAGQPDVPGSLLRAVLTGVGIDVCASKLIGYLMLAVYLHQVTTPGMTDAQVVDALRNTPPSFLLMLVESVLGALVSVAAGFACARIVQRDEWRVGVITACGAVFVGLLLDEGTAPDDLLLLYVACDVACVMLGVKFGIERNRRIEALAREQADAPTS